MPPKKQKQFKPSVSAETQFGRALRKIARLSGHIVEAHVDGATITDEPGMQKALKDYAKLIEPWARRQSEKMLNAVQKKNTKAYKEKSKEIARRLQSTLVETHVDQVMELLMQEHVTLITTIPEKAGIRAQKLAYQAVVEGKRADEVAKELMETTNVSESDATRIARTEVARANALITEARAVSAGADSYIWRTTMDGAERESHRKMNGKTILYRNPPTLSDGTTGHAGTLINCRCWQDVQFND